jgi:hypothetical protein
MVDNNGIQYSGITASPPQVILNPGESGTVTISMPLIRSNAVSLMVYFNTDLSALDTKCALVTPASPAISACRGA